QGFILLSYARAPALQPCVSRATRQRQAVSGPRASRAQVALHPVISPPSSEAPTALPGDETLSRLAEVTRPMTMTSRSEARLRSLVFSARRALRNKLPAEQESLGPYMVRTNSRCFRLFTTRS